MVQGVRHAEVVDNGGDSAEKAEAGVASAAGRRGPVYEKQTKGPACR